MFEKGGKATSTRMRMHSPLKWHVDGGKHYLAKKIVAMMPPHIHYVEPYAGGLSVLLAKDPEGVSEVVNDLNRQVANFWQTIRSEHTFKDFVRAVECQPFCEGDWRASNSLRDCMGWHGVNLEGETTNANTARAAWFFVACRQSLAGRMDTFASLSRNRTRGGMNEQVSAWLTAVEGLPAVHARLKRVVILNRDALDVIRQQDGPQTMFYLDPPYLHETRATTGEYEHEMSQQQHDDLLALLSVIKGKFLLSGYRSQLYDTVAKQEGWHRTDFNLPNNSAGGKTKRRMTESVWTNFIPEKTCN